MRLSNIKKLTPESLVLMIPWIRARWAARSKRAASEDKNDSVQTRRVPKGSQEALCANKCSTTRSDDPGEPNDKNQRRSTPSRWCTTHPRNRAPAAPPPSLSTTPTPSTVSMVHSLPSQSSTVCTKTHVPHDRTSLTAHTRTSRRSSAESSCTTSNIESAASSSEEIGQHKQKEHLRVRIICPSARVLTFQCDINKRLVELKNEVILELSDDPLAIPLFATDVRNLSPRYRLMRAEYQGTELNETMTLGDLKVEDNAMFALVPRRQHLQQMTALTRDVQPPRDIDIQTATRNIVPRIADIPMVDINEIFQQSNLQFDVRKVLISLAQASAAFIGSGAYATRLIAMLKQKLINKRNYQNDTLQCLVDMGFKREKAEYSLKVNQGVYSAALEWLILHQSEDNALEEAAVGLQKSQSVLSPSGIFTNDSVIENTQALLEIVRIYSHRDIPPTPEIVQALVEMGFEEAEVILALKKTCNNKAAACEWLCGNRTGSLVELRDGLSQDSPILKTILEMPQVQMNLSNPKILLAFLSILENENSIRVWGGDNDTTSVITHILQKYHEEKHVLGINQFYNNRL